MGASTSWNPQGLSRPVMGLPFIARFGIKISAYNILVEYREV
jgi:hypothetical protein